MGVEALTIGNQDPRAEERAGVAVERYKRAYLDALRIFAKDTKRAPEPIVPTIRKPIAPRVLEGAK